MARFHVRDTFALRDKTIFVLAGFVIEGEVTDGMYARLPFRENVSVTAKIDHIRSLQRPDGTVVCLCLRCTAEEVALWEALKVKDQTVEIIPNASPE